MRINRKHTKQQNHCFSLKTKVKSAYYINLSEKVVTNNMFGTQLNCFFLAKKSPLKNLP